MAGASPEPAPLGVLAQHCLPQHLLTHVAHQLARNRLPWLKQLLIRAFIRRYGVDMSEAQLPDADAYPDFNSFFTRALKDGRRPLSSDVHAVVSPVDGEVSQAGTIENGTLIQAKGRRYSTAALLGDAAAAAAFDHGRFATLYLSPRDYHRVHMPVAGRLESMRCIPGRLFSVNHATTAAVENLFARNERVVCRFNAACGPLAVVLVGALIVGGIETVWHGPVTPAAPRRPQDWRYGGAQPAPDFLKGAEIGRFNVGSTAILLFGPGAIEWDPWLTPGTLIKVGQRIGRTAQARANAG